MGVVGWKADGNQVKRPCLPFRMGDHQGTDDDEQAKGRTMMNNHGDHDQYNDNALVDDEYGYSHGHAHFSTCSPNTCKLHIWPWALSQGRSGRDATPGTRRQ